MRALPVVLAAGLLGLALALLLTPWVRGWATRRGWVCHPRADRWSSRTVALMGGLAIVAATFGGALVFARGFDPRALALLAAAGFMAVVGIIDDRNSVRPHTKLLAQVLAALLLVRAGFRFGLPESWLLVDQCLAVLWIVGIGNAFNLLDNMDGLCAGVAAITASFMTVICLSHGAVGGAVLTAALAGACVGYLRYNWHPASIFMGDGGSLFIGTLLAGSALLTPGMGSGSDVIGILALPVLVMLMPLLDTTLVTVARKWARRPVSQGGRDHSSHRLVAIGLTEPRAVQLLCWLAVVGGAAALAVRWLDWYLASLLLPIILLGAGALGLYLGGVTVYEDHDSLGDVLARTPIPLIAQHRYRRRMAEVMLDTFCIALGFYISNILRYESGLVVGPRMAAFVDALPIVVACHLVAYHVVGVYRGIWRYTSVSDLPRFAGAVLLGLALTVFTLAVADQLSGLSRTLLVINVLVQLALLSGTRLSIKLLRDRLLAAGVAEGAPVLVVGLGEEAELELRRLRIAAGGRTIVGTLCENEQAVGRRVLDCPVLGTSHTVEQVFGEHAIAEVVLIDEQYPDEAWQRIVAACAAHGIPAGTVRNTIDNDIAPPPARAVN